MFWAGGTLPIETFHLILMRHSTSLLYSSSLLLCLACSGPGQESSSDLASGGASQSSAGGTGPGGAGGSLAAGGSPSDSGGSSAGGATFATGGAPSAGGAGTNAGGEPVFGAGGDQSGGAENSSGGHGESGGSGGSPPLHEITVWIAGDSTVANGNTPCPRGWGGTIGSLFGDLVTVTNSAVGGRSVRTWMHFVQGTMGTDDECLLDLDGDGVPLVQDRWQAMLDGMSEGDFLLIQFGINDGSPTCDRHVGLTAFKDSYRQMAQAAADRGAQAIFITPVSAISCQGSSARGTRGGYVTATQEIGTELGVPVIDLHQLSVDLYTDLGFCPLPNGESDVGADTTGAVGTFFCDDHTHFDQTGAEAIADLLAQALRDQSSQLAEYLQ